MAPLDVGTGLLYAGMVLIFLGFALVVIAASKAGGGKSKVAGGAVVMVGPVPVVFASDFKWASLVIVLAIVLVVLWFFLGWG